MPTVVKKEPTLSPEIEADLRESLKRCSPGTMEAVLSYRNTGDTRAIPAVVMGIIERFLEPENRPKLKHAGNDVLLVEDLGLDSLLMVEIIILVEETLDISIPNEEMRELRTVNDLKEFIDCKVKGIKPPYKPRHLSVQDIAAFMPHQDPFLFVQEATLYEDECEGLYEIRGDEFFLEGHFKGKPIFPASLMIEALGQLAVLQLLKSKRPEIENLIDPQKVYFASCDGVRCHKVCVPGDSLTLKTKLKRIRFPLASFEGRIMAGSEKVAFAEDITLAFDYAK